MSKFRVRGYDQCFPLQTTVSHELFLRATHTHTQNPTHSVPCPSLLRTPSRARGRATCGRSRVEARRRAHHCVEPSSHFQALAQARQGMPRCALHSRSSYVAAAATCFELEPILTLIPSLGLSLSPNPNPKPDPTQGARAPEAACHRRAHAVQPGVRAHQPGVARVTRAAAHRHPRARAPRLHLGLVAARDLGSRMRQRARAPG